MKGGSEGVRVSLEELLRLRGEARRLDIAPRGRVLATHTGGHLSRFRGRGMEFDESRAYQPGDDVRNMDWRVTARTGKPHVKCFREERERPLWLLVDQGASMRFGTRVAFKSVIAARAAALLAWAAADQGDRVGGLIFDETRRVERRPAPRTRGVLPFLGALSQGAAPARGARGFPSIASAAEALGRLVHPGSLIFILSDFLDLRNASAWFGELTRDNELVLIHLSDPLEREAPPPGWYPVTDGRRRGVLDTRPRDRRHRWAERFHRHRAELEHLARRNRVHLLPLSTEEPVGPALARGLSPRPAIPGSAHP